MPVALGVVLILAACAAEPPAEPADDPTPATVDICTTAGGVVVDAIDVSGDWGAEPAVTFEAPLEVDTTERRIVIDGDGDSTGVGDSLTVAYTVLNGSDGTVIESFGYTAGESAEWAADPQQLLAGFAMSIGCLDVGTRVVAVIPPAEAFGEEGYANLGIGVGESLVLVADILGVQPSRAWGEDQDVADGLPVVTLEASGAPSVEVPAVDPPTELQIGLLKKGDGPVVGATDTVTLQYHGVAWRTGEVFDESWPTPTSFPLTGVVEGFAAAIAGQTVGSQIIAVIPPALAYGEEGTSTSQLAGETLIFVIDILGTTAP